MKLKYIGLALIASAAMADIPANLPVKHINTEVVKPPIDQGRLDKIRKMLKPDLVVLDKLDGHINYDAQHKKSSVPVQVKNAGMKDAVGTFTVCLYHEGKTYTRDVINGLKVGETKTVTITVDGSMFSPDAIFDVKADCQNAINESNEQNNLTAFTFVG